MPKITNLASGLFTVLRPERKEIFTIYFYAIFSGLIQLSLPLGVQAIIGYVMGGAMVASILLLISLVVLGVFFVGLLQVNQMKIIEKLQQRIFVRYGFIFAERIPAFDLEKADGQYLPELTNRFFDTLTLQKGLSKILLDIPAATIQILFGLLLLSIYHPAFILFGLVLLFLLWIILYFTGARGLQTSLKESTHKYAVAGWLEEMARTVRSFKYSQGTHFNLRKADEKIAGYLDARTSHFRVLLVQFGALLSFKVIITAFMLFVGAYLLVNQQLNIGQFIAAEIVVLTVIAAVEKMIVRLDSIYDVLTSVEKLNQVALAPVEPETAMEMPLPDKPLKLEMRSVNFGYGSETPVLQNLSFVAEPGQKIAITGSNGSGKSTILRLFTGSYAGYTGSILINDIPLGNYPLQTLRSASGILVGQMDIFEGTLWENITLGRENISMAEVMELAEKTGLSPFIAAQKEGLNTWLQPAGHRIPGSISRKILLLRALVNRPRLLLLEEPWLGFSEADKQRLQTWLLNRFPETTMLIVTADEEFSAQCHKTLRLNHH